MMKFFNKLSPRYLSAFFIGILVILAACSKNENGAKKVAENLSRPLNATQTSEGGWESSGGDGVACFKDNGAAKIARAELTESGFLSSKTRKEIQSIVTLETWDFLQLKPSDNSKVQYLSELLKRKSFSLASEILQIKNAQQILEVVLNNLNPSVPLFNLRIKMVAKSAPLSSWIGSTQIPQIDDSTPARPIDNESPCVLVQLADRKTKSIEGKLPETQIVYDKELFDKYLSETDKALLVLHEYLYLIGKEGKHKNSDAIRRINSYLFSTDIFNLGVDLKYLSNKALAMRQIIGYPFGDYMRFFRLEDIIKNDHLSFQDSRYNALISLMDKARTSKTSCLDKNGFDKKSAHEQNKLLNFCQREVIENNPDLWNSLTDEEAYIYLARFHFDQTSEINGASLGIPFQGTGLDMNSEALSVPGDDTSESTALAKKYCGLTMENLATEFLSIHEKAKLYCKDQLGLNTVRLKDTPLKKTTGCSSYERLDISTSEGTISARFFTKFDKNTGAIHDDTFTGKIISLSSHEGDEGRNLGMGNREYASENTYRIAPASQGNIEEFIWLLNSKQEKLLQPEPGLFISLTTRTGGNEVIIKNQSEALQVLLSASSETIVGMDVRLKCDNRETNLPDEAWYVH
jgi:hypothetical protein